VQRKGAELRYEGSVWVGLSGQVPEALGGIDGSGRARALRLFAGHTLRAAREVLNLVGLDGRTASTILWTYRADRAKDELAAAGITEITSLVHQSQIPE